MSAAADVPRSIARAAHSSRKSLLKSWILVPFSVVVMLYFVLAINSLIGLGTVDFPASVACLLILFFFLLAASLVLPDKHMHRVLNILDVPTGFALRTMNLYFTPSFILLPLSTSISGEQIGALIGVFVIGYVAQFALTAYTCRALQLLLTRIRRSDVSPSGPRTMESEQTLRESGSNGTSSGDLEKSGVDSTPSLPADNGETQRTQCESTDSIEPARQASQTQNLEPTFSNEQLADSRQRAERWAVLLAKKVDVAIYLVLFVFIGIPVYYATGYSMPIFLCLNVLIFLTANAVPPKIKRVAHPVLVTALFAILTIWVLALTRHQTLQEGLHLYRTNTSYLEYLKGTEGLPLPGAGDILASLLDASIVSLAMPMYQYRKELYHFFFAIFAPVVVLTVPSLLGYPPLCSALGVSATISLAVAPRSVTLALAQLSADNLGGNSNAISVIAVVSGISGPIFGPTILKLLRISKDDYVTTGVVLGANSSAIATAMLLEKDRRAAALSSLTMSLFGLLFVILTVIPQLKEYVRSLVGL